MTEPNLAPGLYLVATPIGSARDITLRALDILATADVIAAEDTRNARKLMEIHGIKRGGRDLLAYHDHNGAAQRPKLLSAIRDGKSVAFVSDAGTPLVADPGFTLARAVIDEGLPVTSAPGPSAVLAALSIAGMPTDRFAFLGFPPVKGGARKRFFEEHVSRDLTVVFYETGKRLDRTLQDLCSAFGEDRPIAICRELTKRFEQALRGSIGAVIARREAEMPLKGEFVIVLGPQAQVEASAEDLDESLRSALARASVKDAVSEVSQMLGLPKKTVYQRALDLKKT